MTIVLLSKAFLDRWGPTLGNTPHRHWQFARTFQTTRRRCNRANRAFTAMHPYSTRKPVELFGLKGRPACVVFDKFVSQCLIQPFEKRERGHKSRVCSP